MNGYFRPKHLKANEELRPLTLDEIEYVNEDGEQEDSRRRRQKRWDSLNCPRCWSETFGSSDEPYCDECGWDSVIDETWTPPRCID